ncbi:hypothetical protein PG996_006259 [Apiospora saccharicola]|uniref:Uncharacterized protein n=1 Tax=Apiospora saccharicola TaxID=335842 RepID=A0ABR1VNT3_9PEZI
MARSKYEDLWSKWLLLPCWMVQMGGSIIFGISGAILLIGAVYGDQLSDELGDGNDFYGYSPKELAGWLRITGAVVLAFALMTFLFCVIEIVLYATRILNPAVVLAFSCLKASGWGVMVVLDIATVSQGAHFPWSNFILAAVLLMTALLQLVVSAKYTHHQRIVARDRGHYAKTGASAVGIEAGFYQPANGNHTQISSGPGPKQQMQQQDTEYRSPSPDDLARNQDETRAPLVGNRDDDAGVERRQPPPSYY